LENKPNYIKKLFFQQGKMQIIKNAIEWPQGIVCGATVLLCMLCGFGCSARGIHNHQGLF
jgi:hypothetical protein